MTGRRPVADGRWF